MHKDPKFIYCSSNSSNIWPKLETNTDSECLSLEGIKLTCSKFYNWLKSSRKATSNVSPTYIISKLETHLRSISKVLRIQPKKIYDFIANYLSALLITREHGIMAMKILEDLCDCQPSVVEHLIQLNFEREQAEALALIIKEEIEGTDPAEGKETVKEHLLLKKVLAKMPIDEEMSAQLCQVARNAYRDYIYKKNLLKQGLKMEEEQPWEIAARNTLNLYKKTKPSFPELNRATKKIQAAYKGYHVRRRVLWHLLPKKDKKKERKVDLRGPPLDIAGSREMHFGTVINIKTPVDNIAEIFANEKATELGLQYDPKKTITHVEDEYLPKRCNKIPDSKKAVKMSDSTGKAHQLTDEIELSHDDDTDLTDKSLGADEPTDQSTTRISFSIVPPHIIESAPYAEIPEENIVPQPAVEDAQEVPEDLPVSDNDGTDSTNGTSIQDTTADATDVEFDGDEQEG